MMRRIILLLVAISSFSPASFSEQSETIRLLSSEKVSVLDLGIYKLHSDLLKIDLSDNDSSYLHTKAAWYWKKNDQILIDYEYFQIKGKSPLTKDEIRIECNRIIEVLRDKYSGRMELYFSHALGLPDDPAFKLDKKKLEDAILLRVIFVKGGNLNHQCSSTLSSPNISIQD